MQYELINPSDKIYFDADEHIVAWLAVVLIGNGMYGAETETEKNNIPICLFGWRETFKITFQKEPEQALEENKKQLTKCLFSFRTAHERTSLNDICKNACTIATELS